MFLIVVLLIGTVTADESKLISSIPSPTQPDISRDPSSAILLPSTNLQVLSYKDQAGASQIKPIIVLNEEYPTPTIPNDLRYPYDKITLSFAPTAGSYVVHPAYDNAKVVLLPNSDLYRNPNSYQTSYANAASWAAAYGNPTNPASVNAPVDPSAGVAVTAITPSGSTTYNGNGVAASSTTAQKPNYGGGYTPNTGAYYGGTYYQPGTTGSATGGTPSVTQGSSNRPFQTSGTPSSVNPGYYYKPPTTGSTPSTNQNQPASNYQQKPPPTVTGSSGGFYQGYYKPPSPESPGGYYTGYFWPAGSNQGIYYNGYVPVPNESKPAAGNEGRPPSGSESKPATGGVVEPVTQPPTMIAPLPVVIDGPSTSTPEPPPGAVVTPTSEKPWWLTGTAQEPNTANNNVIPGTGSQPSGPTSGGGIPSSEMNAGQQPLVTTGILPQGPAEIPQNQTETATPQPGSQGSGGSIGMKPQTETGSMALGGGGGNPGNPGSDKPPPPWWLLGGLTGTGKESIKLTVFKDAVEDVKIVLLDDAETATYPVLEDSPAIHTEAKE